MDYMKESLKLHYEWKGKIAVKTKTHASNRDELSLAYTPGVAAPCLEIQKDYSKSFELTGRWNTVAVITNGTAVLGLGDIGPEAGMPVMEGKCLLFKEFADIDALPICVRSKDVDEMVKTISLISGSFGGINLEDISAPACFEIEKQLKEICDIPVFHDDQHGTAVVVLAATLNALKVVGKKIEDCTVAMSGAGAAGAAIGALLHACGAKNIIMCNSKGIISRKEGNTPAVDRIAAFTNNDNIEGTLADAMKGADIFVGVSKAGLVTAEMIGTMAEKPIIMAMANPVPEIMPDEAKAAGAAVVCTGRSDYPNQANNVLAFPGIFRGALDCRASDINEEMKLAAAYAIAELISDEELNADYVLPAPFDERVAPAVAKAVAKAAKDCGIARI
ncbi:MAG: NAD-dependent malic enzyme [Clostridia bacterium]|nr:NAD-dependent malic enzyme [Clostridia bacterium]